MELQAHGQVFLSRRERRLLGTTALVPAEQLAAIWSAAVSSAEVRLQSSQVPRKQVCYYISGSTESVVTDIYEERRQIARLVGLDKMSQQHDYYTIVTETITPVEHDQSASHVNL